MSMHATLEFFGKREADSRAVPSKRTCQARSRGDHVEIMRGTGRSHLRVEEGMVLDLPWDTH